MIRKYYSMKQNNSEKIEVLPFREPLKILDLKNNFLKSNFCKATKRHTLCCLFSAVTITSGP